MADIEGIAEAWGPLRKYARINTYMKHLFEKGLTASNRIRGDCNWASDIIPRAVARRLPPLLEGLISCSSDIDFGKKQAAEPGELVRTVHQITLFHLLVGMVEEMEPFQHIAHWLIRRILFGDLFDFRKFKNVQGHVVGKLQFGVAALPEIEAKMEIIVSRKLLVAQKVNADHRNEPQTCRESRNLVQEYRAPSRAPAAALKMALPWVPEGSGASASVIWASSLSDRSR